MDPDELDELIVVTPGGNIRSFKMMLARALHLKDQGLTTDEAVDKVFEEVDGECGS